MGEVFVEVLGRVDVFDAWAVRRDQLRCAAEADDLDRRTPVPAAVAGGLTDERLVLRPGHVRHGERPAPRRAATVTFFLRAAEAPFHRVRARLQERLDVELVALEAVGRLADLLTIDEDRRKRVAVLEPKDNLLLRREVRGDIEAARDVPVGPADPLHLLLVAAPERVVHQPRLQERGMDAAGNGDRAGNLGVVRLDEVPVSGEVNLRGSRRDAGSANERRKRKRLQSLGISRINIHIILLCRGGGA